MGSGGTVPHILNSGTRLR